MLTSLQVRNFAIIDSVDIDFSRGMTVLTGETGAGKSILVDALGLVLGERGGGGLVRSGAKRAEFTAEFDLGGLTDARNWLAQQMLDEDNECNLRRVIGADGRSRAFINGNSVPLQSLKRLGELLLDIHGQHFHQSLGRRDVQRAQLDYFGGLVDLSIALGAAFDDWQAQLERLHELESADQDRTSRLEFLRFQIDELETLDLKPGEPADLLQERVKLQNSGRIAEGVNNALQQLYEAEPTNAHALLADAAQSVESLASLDDALQPVGEMLRDAHIQVAEAADGLRRYGDALDMDPSRQEYVEERLDAIQNIARKHRIDPDELCTLHDQLNEQLSDLLNAEERGAELAQVVQKAEDHYRQLANRLSTARKKAAKKFSAAVTAAMDGLGMPGGSFNIQVSPRDITAPRAYGLDDIDYLISANPGQKLMPLAKVASGGELSRMSLAIQVIASDGSAIPTMIFDEVDSGVGGGVAEMVGRRLRELGRTRQVFCVTHLPQVASLGNNHFRVMKVSDGRSTKTSIAALSRDERVEEIARMLGGVEITQRTREHAEEMLRSALDADATDVKSA